MATNKAQVDKWGSRIILLIYYLYFIFSVLCGDFVFVIVFPQLLLVLYYPKSNTYGSVFAFFFGLLLRLLCGEKAMSLPPSMSFGKIYACGYNSTIYPDTDGYTTITYPGIWNDA